MRGFDVADHMANRMYDGDPVLIALTGTQRRKLIEAMRAAGVASATEFDSFLKEAKVVEMLRISRYLLTKNPGMDGSKRIAIAEKIAAQKLQSELALDFALAEIMEPKEDAEAEAEVKGDEFDEIEWNGTYDDSDE